MMDRKNNVYIPWGDWGFIRLVHKDKTGTTFEIRHDSGTERRALMRAIPVSGNDRSKMESLFRNAQKANKISTHPNILTCEDVQVKNDENGHGWTLYVRKEQYNTLPSFIKEKQLDLDEVIRLGTDICQAIAECEKQKLTLGGIKPSNIYVNERGRFLLDIFTENQVDVYSYEDQSTGIEPYTAPEIIQMEEYGAPADLYSLGMIMYWLLNDKRLPFRPHGKIPNFLEEEIYEEKRLSGEKLPKPHNGSELLKKIVLKACAFDPTDRYESAQAMLEDLVQAKKEEEAYREAQKQRESKRKKKKKLLMLAAAVLLAGALAWFLIVHVLLPNIQQETEYTETEAECTETELAETESTRQKIADHHDLTRFFDHSIEDLKPFLSDHKVSKRIEKATFTDEEIYLFDHDIIVFTHDGKISTIVLWDNRKEAKSKYNLSGVAIGTEREDYNEKKQLSSYTMQADFDKNEKAWYICATALDYSESVTQSDYYKQMIDMAFCIGMDRELFEQIHTCYVERKSVEMPDHICYRMNTEWVTVDRRTNLVDGVFTKSDSFLNNGFYVNLSSSKRSQYRRPLNYEIYVKYNGDKADRIGSYTATMRKHLGRLAEYF